MKREKVYLTFIYLISPVIGFFIGLRSRNKDLIKYNIALLSIWIGFSFSFASGSNSDIVRYHERFVIFQNSDYSFNWLLDQLYVKGGYFDVFSIFSTFIFTKLGFSFEIYLGFFGFVFSLFYSKYILQLLDMSNKFSLIKKIFFLFAVLVIPIWYGINNIRFTLVTMILVTSIYELTNHKNVRKNYILICLTPLIHFSVFWVPITVVFIFKLSKYLNLKLLFYSFIMLSILPMRTIALQSNLSNYIPTLYEDRASAYVDSDNISNRMEVISQSKVTSNFYVRFLDWPYTWIFHLLPMMLGLTFLRNVEMISKDDIVLLKWILFFGLIVAFIGSLPSFGRYKAFVILPSILLLFDYWKLMRKSFRFGLLSIASLMMLYSIVKLRTALDYLSETTLFGNPVSLFITDVDSRVSLINFIKDVF